MTTSIPFGLSTSWNGRRHESLSEVLTEIQALGFSAVELYAHFTPTQLQGAPILADRYGLQVKSLHGPCPVPVGSSGEPSVFGDWLASTDEAQRTRAVDAIRETIDAAAHLRARAAVVHLGGVEVESLQERVFETIQQCGYGSSAHQALLDHARNEREQLKEPHLEAALASARAIGEHARGTGVMVGLESRARYFQIPSLDEFAQVFAACEGLPIGYWHDAGHAQRLENGGFLRHEDYLRRYADRMVGMHLHDTRGDLDHLAPGLGEIDFAMLADYVSAETILTLELAQSVPREHLLPGVEVLRGAGFARQRSALPRS